MWSGELTWAYVDEIIAAITKHSADVITVAGLRFSQTVSTSAASGVISSNTGTYKMYISSTGCYHNNQFIIPIVL